MQTGALTSYLDVAQLTLYAFWLFFAGLIYYLVRENKREGYPLVTDQPGKLLPGFPPPPPPKGFILHDGSVAYAPRNEPAEVVAARPTAPWSGAPITPTGNPLVDGIGPAAWALHRADVPDITFDDSLPKIVPLRTIPEFFLADEDPDPRGMTVIGHDGVLAGTVVDSWIDRSEVVVRYFEVELAVGGGTVLLPQHYARISRKHHRIKVGAITAAQFRDVPRLKNAETVTLLEEEKLVAYFGGGFLYATPGPPGAHPMSPLRSLPAGERMLWQGVPDWRVLARDAFHLRGLACYFGFIVAWCAVSSVMDGTPAASILLSSLKLAGMALIPLGLLVLYCWAVGRSTVYSITSRRIVIQLGLAVPMTINLPFVKVDSAGMRAGKAGFGDITLLLMPGERLAYLMLWPHARPWRMARAEPMLRAIPDAAHVGQVLGRALAASASMPVPALAPQQQAAGIGAHAPIAA